MFFVYLITKNKIKTRLNEKINTKIKRESDAGGSQPIFGRGQANVGRSKRGVERGQRRVGRETPGSARGLRGEMRADVAFGQASVSTNKGMQSAKLQTIIK